MATDPLALYNVASTLFLGAGIAVVLQGRLVTRKPDFPIAERWRAWWAMAEVIGAFAMLALIVAGEIIVITVLEAGESTRNQDILIKVLLGSTGFYVVLHSAVGRGISHWWNEPKYIGAGAELDPAKVEEFFFAILAGSLFGLSAAAAVWFSNVLPLIFGAAYLIFHGLMMPRLYHRSRD